MNNSPDTLNHAWPDSHLPVYDSLPPAMEEIAVPIPEEIPVTAGDVFGNLSVLHTSAPAVTESVVSMADSLWYQLPVICLAAVYFIYAVAYGGRIVQLLRLTFSNRDEQEGEDYIKMYSGFTNGLVIAGWFLIGVTVLKVMDIWGSRELTELLPDYFPVMLIGLICAVGILVSMVQQTVIAAAGKLTFSTEATEKLLAARKLEFGAFTITATPVALLFALAPQTVAIWLIYAFAVIALLFVLHAIYRSAILFFQEKISILVWILYLCAVEAMPYALIVVATLRNLQF